MKTTYINDKGILSGFIISKCGRWVDAFTRSESNIINSFFTFGKDGSSISRPNITPTYKPSEIALMQRLGVLHRGQKLVAEKCDKLSVEYHIKQMDSKFISGFVSFYMRKVVGEDTPNNRKKYLEMLMTIKDNQNQ